MIHNMFTITTEIIYVEHNPQNLRFATAWKFMERPGQSSDPSYLTNWKIIGHMEQWLNKITMKL